MLPKSFFSTPRSVHSFLKLTRVKQGFDIEAVGLVQTGFLFENLEEESSLSQTWRDADSTGRIPPT